MVEARHLEAEEVQEAVEVHRLWALVEEVEYLLAAKLQLGSQREEICCPSKIEGEGEPWCQRGWMRAVSRRLEAHHLRLKKNRQSRQQTSRHHLCDQVGEMAEMVH